MKTWMKGALVGMLAVPALAVAQGNTSAAPEMSCYDVRYSLDFLDRYPMAPALCQMAVEKDGIKYAKMTAKVTKKYKGMVMVGFENVAGTVVSRAGARPAGRLHRHDRRQDLQVERRQGGRHPVFLPARACAERRQPAGRWRAHPDHLPQQVSFPETGAGRGAGSV